FAQYGRSGVLRCRATHHSLSVALQIWVNLSGQGRPTAAASVNSVPRDFSSRNRSTHIEHSVRAVRSVWSAALSSYPPLAVSRPTDLGEFVGPRAPDCGGFSEQRAPRFLIAKS